VDGIKRRFLGLCLPPLLFCLLDDALTLLGQSAEYWAGDYARVNEGSPTFHDLLQIHPAAFLLGNLIWILIFVVGIFLLPDALALILSIAVTFGHTAGAATWIWSRFHYGYQVSLGLFLLSAIVLGVGIRWGWRAVPEREHRPRGWPSLVRWALVTLLSGVGVYLFLWPRDPTLNGVAAKDAPAAVVDAIASTDRELEQLAGTRQVTQLCLVGPEITVAGLKQISRLTHLQQLKLREVQLADASLKDLGRLSKLKWLSLELVEIASAELEHLKGLPQLQHLTLIGPQVTDAWLKHLNALSELECLLLVSTKVTDAGLEHLKGSDKLQSLILMGTLVNGAGLEHLKGLPQLHYVNLGETKINDAGLEHLKGLSQLRQLYLGGTNCTPEGKKRLQQALPKCRID
jgi:hypothetical protein